MSTTRTRRIGLIATAGVMALSSLAVAAMPVAAATEREKRGVCTGTSDWELELEREHGRIEINLDVDTTRVNRQWRVRMKHDGKLFVNTLRRTDRDRDIEIERHRNDTPGTDRIWFKAVDQVNGEVCKGSLTI
ncbi:MAG: hypothetical protein KF809_07505 [Chloroflexi bacterium]|nr:hypothetical protein [Chloroflexota bacterium]